VACWVLITGGSVTDRDDRSTGPVAPVSWCDRRHGGFEAAVVRVARAPTAEAESLAFALVVRWKDLGGAEAHLVPPDAVRQLQLVSEVLPAAASAGRTAVAQAEARALDRLLEHHC
jgi:hypothetical protein